MQNHTDYSSPQISPDQIPLRKRGPTRQPQLPFSEDVFKRPVILENEDMTVMVGFHGSSKKRSGLKLSLWTWFSASIDTLVLISICCFFAVVFSFIMKTSPGSVVTLFIKNQHFGYSLSALFVMSIWSYLVFMRAFIGASIGEWTCDLRLGEPVQRFSLTYIFKVMFRTTIILTTGIVTIPLISLMLGRDLAGEISGVKIYSLQ